MPNINSINNNSASMTIDPEALTDSFVQFNINNAPEFRIGSDLSASNAFKIARSNSLGINDTFIMTPNGERTVPLQPAFSTSMPVGVLGTGNGLSYTVGWTTERFDQGNNLSGATFTAPVTGRYRLTASVWIRNITTTLYSRQFIEINTSNRVYKGAVYNPYVRGANGGTSPLQQGSPLEVLADMDAGDTATVVINVASFTQNIEVISGTGGAAALRGFFTGSLVC